MTEYRDGGISRLVERMRQFTGSKVTATSYTEGVSNQQYTSGIVSWVRAVAKDIVSVFERNSDHSDDASRHQDADTTAEPEAVSIEMPSLPNLLLLACMHKTQGGKGLLQDDIGVIENDRQLFCRIQEQLARLRGPRQTSPPLMTVSGIHFTKVG